MYTHVPAYADRVEHPGRQARKLGAPRWARPHFSGSCEAAWTSNGGRKTDDSAWRTGATPPGASNHASLSVPDNKVMERSQIPALRFISCEAVAFSSLRLFPHF